VKYLIQQIADSLYMITLPMPFRLEHVHVFVLIHDGSLALFDTGMNTPDTFSKLEEALERIGKSVHDIDRIFLTHYHTDHCGMAGRLKEISGASIHMSRIGSTIIEIQKNEELVINRIKDFYISHGLSEKAIDTLITFFRGFRKVTVPFKADVLLDPPHVINLGSSVIEVLPTPGHTRGHVSYFFPKEGLLLSGDHVLPEITPNLSPDLFCPDFHPLESFLESLKMIGNLPVVKVYPAHGDPFSNLKGRVEEIREHHRERKGLAFDSIKKGPKTSFQASLDIFGHDLPEFDRFLAINETYVHLLELQKEGAIKEEKRGRFLLYSAV
jgi:glyoxylase-like metal-dependent hydrolase (beta-lactamase superfamily II)